MLALARKCTQKWGIAFGISLVLAGCGSFSGFFDGDNTATTEALAEPEDQRDTIWDLFNASDDPNTTLEVNKYLWNASFDILNFLPIQTADPFSGVIVTGYGTPPGGRTAYRATIFIRDPALEARSLNLALATRSGPASTETVRAVEDAILTRARQLRIADLNL
ncbi:MAG: DUF3576 domain-containing protein [Boseongicola sp.]|nr:MAG: DUF3576 domain-containing protein [Boseongicola sp.]